MDETEAPDAPDVEEEDDEEVVPRRSANPPRIESTRSGFVAKAWTWQHAIDRKWDSIGRGRIARVLRMARKPEPDEFRQSAVIVLVGIAVIGGIGFFTYLLMSSLIKYVTPT